MPLGRQQTVEEGSVALQRYPQIFGGNVLAAAPLCLESFAFFCEAFSELLHDVGD